MFLMLSDFCAVPVSLLLKYIKLLKKKKEEAWVGIVVLQGQGVLSVELHAQNLLKEVAIIFITSTIVWSQVK